jgi:hypothetical protein
MAEATEEAELGGVPTVGVTGDGIPVRAWCWLGGSQLSKSPASIVVGPTAGVDLHRRCCHACVNGTTVPKSV